MIKHGYAPRVGKSRAYIIWNSMIQRCHSPTTRNYYLYGARGITVCKRWREDFTAFLGDMGQPPPGLTLDRKDGELGYCKENCRWATRREQTRNTRLNRVIEFGGEKMIMADWAARVGMSSAGLRARLNSGWSVEAALTTKSASKRKSKECAAAIRGSEREGGGNA